MTFTVSTLLRPGTLRAVARQTCLVAIAACGLTALAGCSGGTMNSYADEKTRIRSALPSAVTCSESGQSGQRVTKCKDGTLDVTLMESTGGSGLTVQVWYSEGMATSPDVFLKLMDAYGFKSDQVQRCATDQRLMAQFDTYLVNCTMISRGTYGIGIVP